MKKGFKLIVPSLLAILVCVLLLAGSTFALFTSDVTKNIVVGSATVNMTAEYTEFKAYSVEADDNGTAGEATAYGVTSKYKYSTEDVETVVANSSYIFANKGTAKLTDENTIELVNVTPGDRITANLKVTNNSNVDIIYRVRLNAISDNGLLDGLTVKAGGETLTGVIKVGEWTPWNVPTELTKVENIALEVFLPVEAGNEYQTKQATLRFTIEAVQANAKTDTLLDQVNAYLAGTSSPSKNNTMYDAIQEVKGNTEFAAFDATKYLWSPDTDQFYAPYTVVAGFESHFFKAYLQAEFNELIEQKYNIYAIGEWTGSINITVGFDAGEATGITSINYDRHDATTAQKVVIRTNSASTELVVNAHNDTVKHYDAVGTVHVIAVDDENCYEENGKAAFTQVDSGKYKTTASADVELLYVSDSAKVSVAVAKGTVEHAHAYDEEEAGTINATNPGVTFDYDENAHQNDRVDVYHHVSDAEGLAEGEVIAPKMGFEKPVQGATEEEVKATFEHNKNVDEVKAVVEEAVQEEVAEKQAACAHEYDENGVCKKCGHQDKIYVAQVESTKYEDALTAFKVAKLDNKSVTILANCSVFADDLPDDVDFDLNGKTLSKTYYKKVASADGENIFVDFWGSWNMQGMKDENGNECPQYILVSDETLYRDEGVSASNSEAWVSAKYLVENYSSNCSFYEIANEPVSVFDGNTTAFKYFANGNGSQAKPYIIENVEQFKNMGKLSDYKFVDEDENFLSEKKNTKTYYINVTADSLDFSGISTAIWQLTAASQYIEASGFNVNIDFNDCEIKGKNLTFGSTGKYVGQPLYDPNFGISYAAGYYLGYVYDRAYSVTIKNAKFTNCGVNAENGVSLTLDNCSFDCSSYTKLRSYQDKASTAGAVNHIIKDCKFNNCYIEFGGGSGSSYEINTQFINCEFTKETTGGYNSPVKYDSYTYGNLSFDGCTMTVNLGQNYNPIKIESNQSYIGEHSVSLTIKDTTINWTSAIGTYDSGVRVPVSKGIATILEQGTNSYIVNGTALNYDGSAIGE